MQTKFLTQYSGSRTAEYITADRTITASEAFNSLVISNRDATGSRIIYLPPPTGGESITVIKENPLYRLDVRCASGYIGDGSKNSGYEMWKCGVFELKCYTAGVWAIKIIPEETTIVDYAYVRNYYVDPVSGSDSNDGLTLATAKKTIHAALKLAKFNDTVWLADGTYEGAGNDINATVLPRGNAQFWITIKAINMTKAVLTTVLKIDPGSAGGSYYDNERANFYVQFDGIVWNSMTTKTIKGHYLKFFRCGFRGAPIGGTGEPQYDNVSMVSVGGGNKHFYGASHILFEDCFAWGPGGRYKVLVYCAQKVILRRFVTRWDQGWHDGDPGNLLGGGVIPDYGYPAADIKIYDSPYCEVQNCISIDSLAPQQNPQRYDGSFTLEHNYYILRDVAVRGCIGINNQGNLFQVTSLTTDFVDGTPSDMVNVRRQQRVRGMIVEHCFGSRIGGSSSAVRNGFRVLSSYDGIIANCTLTNLNYSDGVAFLTDLKGRFVRGLRVEDCVVASVLGQHYTGFPGWTPTNNYAYIGATAIADSLAAGLKYPCRLEPGSTLDTEQVGATIIKRIGQSGTLYGEPGFMATGENGINDDLWPWPNEAIIKNCMSAAGGFGDVDRGWTASNLSLTEYIWREMGAVTGPP